MYIYIYISIYSCTHIIQTPFFSSFPTASKLRGAEFGEKADEACKIKFHSLQPHMESCKAHGCKVVPQGSSKLVSLELQVHYGLW